MSQQLIPSDIHGNWPALKAVIAAEPNFDQAVFCGDVVNYGPFPVECIGRILEGKDVVVENPLGSAEAAMILRQPIQDFAERRDRVAYGGTAWSARENT